MNPAWSLTFAALVPFLCLGLMLGLARLEDTLTDGLDSPTRPRAAKPRPAEPVASTGARPVSPAVPVGSQERIDPTAPAAA
jgi:hypothetical protein